MDWIDKIEKLIENDELRELSFDIMVLLELNKQKCIDKHLNLSASSNISSVMISIINDDFKIREFNIICDILKKRLEAKQCKQ